MHGLTTRSRRLAALLVALFGLSACAGEPDGASATAGATSTSTSDSDSSTTAPPIERSPCGVAYGPCEDDPAHPLCVHADGASVCAAECYEYGPGFASGRCERSPRVQQTICPVEEGVPAACLILCDDTSQCPSEGMVCVPCPEPFAYACGSFFGYTQTGPNLCAWPD
ncbi:MAG: hypothetical protein R3A79_14870 [Nannocystaceae bacterium]